MASNLDDPSLWRLTTAGGLKYKFLGIRGRFNTDGGQAVWSGLFQATDLVALAVELFPGPLQVGNLLIPRGGTLPGFPRFIAKELEFSSHVTGKPIDPFSADSAADPATYGPVVRADVQFEPAAFSQDADRDPNDPRTFLEIEANGSGEFLHVPPTGSYWQDEQYDSGGTENPINPETGQAEPLRISNSGSARINTHPNTPLIVRQGLTNWTVRWPQVSTEFFEDVMIHRLRYCRSRVNSTTFALLYDAPRETVLLDTWRLRQNYTWREGLISSPPLTLEINFVEKYSLTSNNIIVGHNHTWEPGAGWRRIQINSAGDPPHELVDFNFLFAVTGL